MLTNITDSIRQWIINLFIGTINNISREEDRADIADWLRKSRDVLDGDASLKEKLISLYGLLDARKTCSVIGNSVTEAVRNYKDSDLPWALKIAIPVTLGAGAIVGAQGVGVAAFGGAIGAPVLLLVFIGSAGITAILEGMWKNPKAIDSVARIAMMILDAEMNRRTSAAAREAMRDTPEPAKRYQMPAHEEALRKRLFTMDPHEFEQHVASFFSRDGIEAYATRKGRDLGVDGYVIGVGLKYVIQCKRNDQYNRVGSPIVQQFKGVIEENDADIGYLVTTSTFTNDAVVSAEKSQKLVMVDMYKLIEWHRAGTAWDSGVLTPST